MGWRYAPLTSAVAVDTRPTVDDAGVRVYNGANASTGIAQGFVEFRTGFPGDTPASITLDSLQRYEQPFPEIPPELVTYGSRLRINGGVTGSGEAQAAVVSLDAEEGVFGGWDSVLRVDATRMEINGQLWARRRTWNLPRSVHTAAGSTTLGVNTWGTLIDQTITGAPAGDYLLTMTHVAAAAAATAGFAQLLVNGVDKLSVPGSSARCDLDTATSPQTFVVALPGFAGGNLRVQTMLLGTTQAPIVTTAASGATVAYLGPAQ